MPKRVNTNPTSIFSGVGINIEREFFVNFKHRSAVEVKNDYPEFGIKSGDVLHLSPVEVLAEDELYYWLVKIDGREYGDLGFMYYNFGDINVAGTTYKKDDVVCCGKVRTIRREYNAKEFLVVADTSTVSCKKCNLQISDDKNFLLGMGWKFKDDYALCVRCR